MRTGIGYRGFLRALLPALGLAACGTNVTEGVICSAEQQYAALCGTAYIDASCQHYATCSFALYKPEIVVAQYQCLSRSLDAKNCASAACDTLTNVQATLTQTAALGPSALAFAQSCTQKTLDCPATSGGLSLGSGVCQPSPLYLDSVYADLASCAAYSCDQYGLCLNAKLQLNLGPGCLSFPLGAVP
jgi:hypothetical protein